MGEIIRFLRSLKKSLPVVLLLLAADILNSYAQDCNTPVIVDLRASPNMTFSINTKRRGNCCGDNNCVTFKVLLNPEADLLNFTPKATGAGFYSIDCGPQLPSELPACLAGKKDAIIITFCKPGANPEDYIIATSKQVQASGDLLLRQGCSGVMSVQGFESHPESITWTSVFPGVAGAYNSYLSCTTGCNKTTVSPLPGAPQYIDYKVSGAANACSDLKSDTIRVYTTPPLTVAMTPENAVLCANRSESIVLTAIPSGGNPPYSYSWSTGQNTAAISVNSPGSYSVTVSDNTTNCSPVTTTTEVAAIPTPPSPEIINNVTICGGNNVVLTPTSPGGTYQWFNDATGGTLLHTGNSYTTPTLNSNVTYYVQTTVNGCTSERVPVIVNILPTPAAPVAPGGTVCSNNAISLKATGSSGNFEWFDMPSGGTLLGVGPTFNTPVLITTTSYYVQATLNGCSSSRTKVTVTIKPIPAPPSVAQTSICAGNAVRLTATGPGGSYEWYDAAIGGRLLATTPDFTTPNLYTTTTYYVQTTINGCTSTRSPVTVTVNLVPASPKASGVVICQNTSATFVVNGATGTLNWYDAPAGGNLLHSGSTFTSWPLEATTTFYVDDTSDSGCTSERTAVTATVIYPDRPAFVYSSGTYCISGYDPVPTTIPPSGGTFSAPPGLFIKDSSTGEIDLSKSSYGVYTVTFVDNTSCHYVTTSTITITNTPDATFSYSTAYCKNQANALPTFPAGSSAGIFSAPPGLVFLNNTTGEIDLKASSPGSYTVMNTIAEENGCSRATYSQTLTIYEEPIVNAGADITICSGDVASLTGTKGGGAATSVWSGGMGTFADIYSPHTIYIPAPGETDVILTLTTNNPSGPCDESSSQVHVRIKPKPYITSANSNIICNDEPVNYTIKSNINGTTFTWNRAAVPGIDNPANDGSGNVITEMLHNATSFPIEVVYQITPSFNGCDGSPFRYAVTVNPSVEVAGPSSATVCNSEPLNYSITSNVSAAEFRWSRESVPGISNLSVTDARGSTINEVLKNTTSSSVVVSYEIIPEAYGCTGEPFTYTVTVKPSPTIINTELFQQICSGESSMPVTLTSSINRTTYQWTAVASPGIQGFQDSGTGEIPAQRLVNQGSTAGAVVYHIIPDFEGCRGETTYYTIKVLPLPPTPAVTSNSPVCEGSELKLSTPAVSGAVYYWTGPNGFSSNQQNPRIPSATTSASGKYTLSILTGNCMSEPQSIAVLINPTPNAPTAQNNSPLCEGNKLILSASTIAGASYVWNGPNGFTSTLQNPELPNAGIEASGVYSVWAIVNGCSSRCGTTTVKINSVPSPVVSSNSPVCTGSDLILEAKEIEGASFHWTGPDGFSSDLLKPEIRNVSESNAGIYSLTVSVNGCTPVTTTLNVVIGLPSLAFAGTNLTICAADPSVALDGSITGGSESGMWHTSGTGHFSPSNTDLKGSYYPSEADIAAGSVVLTLSSTNNQCSGSESSFTLTIVAAPIAEAGPDREVCSGNPLIELDGLVRGASGGSWSTSGTGTFSPSPNSLKAVYIPGENDITSGNVQLSLTSTGNTYCMPAKDVINITITPPPFLSPNLEIFLLQNESIVLDLKPKGEGLSYRWYPADYLNDATLQTPTMKGVESRTYTLSVTGKGGCTTTGQVGVKVLKPIKIPNLFSPNGDGINDFWNISALSDYPDVNTNIFNRYGTKVYSSKGYDHPWDGTYNGTPVPVGTYYYLIEIKSYHKVHSGFISVIR